MTAGARLWYESVGPMTVDLAQRAWVAMALAIVALFVLLLVASAQAEQASSGSGRTAAGFIDAGEKHTCAILADRTVHCWGLGGEGRLGYGSTENISNAANAGAVDLGAGRSARAFAAGFDFSCAILDSGAVRCWGGGANGRLGNGSTAAVLTPAAGAPVDFGPNLTATQIAAGYQHACAILSDGSVRCWGLGTAGRLGYGSQASVGDNEQVASVGPVDLGGRAPRGGDRGRLLSHVRHPGRRPAAVLGLRRLQPARLPGHGERGRRRDARRRWGPCPWAATPFGPSRPRMRTPARSSTTAPRAAGATTWATTGGWATDRPPRCPRPPPRARSTWGRGGARRRSRRRSGTPARSSTPATCAAGAWAATDASGYGSSDDVGDDPGETPATAGPVPLAGRTARAITLGLSHTCALLDDATLRCWGFGGDGRLGYGDNMSVGDSPSRSVALAGPVPLAGPVGPLAADLSLTMAASAGHIGVGGTMSIAITVSNAGPDGADGVSVAVPTPPGLAFVGASADRGSFAGGTWQVGALPAGARGTLTLTVRADVAGTFQLAAEVSSSSVLDPTSTPGNGAVENDRAGATLEVSSPAVVNRTPTLRPLPRSLGLAIARSPKRGRAKTLTVTGRLLLPRATPTPRCGGRVQVLARVGKRIVARRTVTLVKRRGVCRYTAVLRLKPPRAARAVRVSARFLGTTTMRPRSAVTRSVRIR